MAPGYLADATRLSSNVLLIFNFQGKRKGPPTSPSAARDTIHILGEYYPELLGCAIMQDMPWYIRAFVAVFWPFVDPHTKSKVKFHTGAQAVAAGEIAGDVLLRETGGELDVSLRGWVARADVHSCHTTLTRSGPHSWSDAVRVVPSTNDGGGP